MSALTGFSIETISGMPVVAAPAEIDIANTEMLRAALISAAADGYATVVRGHKRAAAKGGELRLVIGAASLLRIFSVIGVDRVIPIFTTLAEALGELPAAATQM